MNLHLEFSPPFNEVTGNLNEILNFEEEITLSELIEFFGKTYGEKFTDLVWEKGEKGVFSKFLSIIINGRSYQHNNFLETKLKDGDQIVFIYIYFGG
ncbi:MAG: MoaD/ThiS family protein [Promethearchaeota archaeon]|jgi:molybdopterin converting factor small subunit